MKKRRVQFPPGARLLSADELAALADKWSRSLFGLSLAEFEQQYPKGSIEHRSAGDIASILEMIQGIRRRQLGHGAQP